MNMSVPYYSYKIKNSRGTHHALKIFYIYRIVGYISHSYSNPVRMSHIEPAQTNAPEINSRGTFAGTEVVLLMVIRLVW